jgi:imidazolonepropionase-like amidohydrolase
MARRQRYIEVRDRLVKAIADSGGKLLISSDTPEWFHLYGYGVHREMQAMAAAGLTPYRIMRAATRDAAEYLGVLREGGTIEPGKRADLVLLRANPLEAIANAELIESVAIGGRWLARAELDRMVERARARIGGKQ